VWQAGFAVASQTDEGGMGGRSEASQPRFVNRAGTRDVSERKRELMSEEALQRQINGLKKLVNFLSDKVARLEQSQRHLEQEIYTSEMNTPEQVQEMLDRWRKQNIQDRMS
jgi:hypothetical protein